MTFKFRHKVLLALGLIVLVVLGTFLGISLWRLQRSAEARVRQGLQNAREAFYLSREQQGKAVADAVQSLAYTNPELRAVLTGRGAGEEDPFAAGAAPSAGDDLQVLESSLPFLPLYQHADQFVVRDREGKVVLAKVPALLPDEEGITVVAREALEGRLSYGWWHAKGQTLQVFAAPVNISDGASTELVGAITVGYRMDAAFLEPLARISQTAIEIAPAGTRTNEDVTVVERAGARYLQSHVPIVAPTGRPVGAFLVSRSLEDEMRDAIALRNQLFLLSALVLLLALVIALYLAQMVSKPLEVLGRAVRAIGGGDLKFRVNYESKDEFGELGHLIDEMASGLEERERIRAAFNRYVDDEVVNEVLKNSGAESLLGEEREISILFSDLANFTSFSEGRSPKELLSHLNSYFAEMAGVISREAGILDKFIGDAVMAYWGAPVSNPRHAELACRAALAQAALFREKFAPAFPGLGLRIGVSTGRAVVGNVGSAERQNYTVMGDTVNLASRLEGVNKAFGTMICVSHATQLAVGSRFVFRLLGDVRVAGRREPEKVYELLGEAGHPGTGLAKTYEEALAHFEAGDLEAAALLVDGLAQEGDGPSRALLARCREGLGPEWTPAWSMSK